MRVPTPQPCTKAFWAGLMSKKSIGTLGLAVAEMRHNVAT